MIKLILKAYPLMTDNQDHKGDTPTHLAARKGDKDLLMLFYQAGADIFFAMNHNNKSAQAIFEETIAIKPFESNIKESHHHQTKRKPKAYLEGETKKNPY